MLAQMKVSLVVDDVKLITPTDVQVKKKTLDSQGMQDPSTGIILRPMFFNKM